MRCRTCSCAPTRDCGRATASSRCARGCTGSPTTAASTSSGGPLPPTPEVLEHPPRAGPRSDRRGRAAGIAAPTDRGRPPAPRSAALRPADARARWDVVRGRWPPRSGSRSRQSSRCSSVLVSGSRRRPRRATPRARDPGGARASPTTAASGRADARAGTCTIAPAAASSARELRGVSRQLAALAPALGPLGVLAKLLGFGGGASGVAARGGRIAVSAPPARPGRAASGGVLAGGIGHVATLLAAAVVTAGGAVEIQHTISAGGSHPRQARADQHGVVGQCHGRAGSFAHQLRHRVGQLVGLSARGPRRRQRIRPSATSPSKPKLATGPTTPSIQSSSGGAANAGAVSSGGADADRRNRPRLRTDTGLGPTGATAAAARPRPEPGLGPALARPPQVPAPPRAEPRRRPAASAHPGPRRRRPARPAQRRRRRRGRRGRRGRRPRSGRRPNPRPAAVSRLAL